MIEDRMRSHLRAFLDAYGAWTLEDYFKLLLTQGSLPSELLVKEIITDLISTYGTEEFQGKDLEGMLLKKRCFFAANHGGIENHPQLIASSLLTSLAGASLHEDNFIFACNLITPKNQTSPLGFYLAQEESQPLGSDFSISFISRRYNNAFLYNIPHLDPEEAALKLEGQLKELKLPSSVKEALLAWRLPEGSDYFTQSSRHNTALYARFLEAAGCRTYFLNEERIAVRLLLRLLEDPASPLFRLLFDRDRLLDLMHNLAGKDNAWRHEVIFRGGEQGLLKFIENHDLRRFGTALFYHIDAKGFKHNLILHDDGGKLTLRSRQAAFKLQPAELAEALKSGALLPNLFLVYFIFALCADASLVGGPFFSVYSKPMLAIPAKLLSLEAPPLPSPNLLQSFILPIKVTGGKLRDHALLHSELLSLPPLSTAQLESLMYSTISDCAALSTAEELLRLDLEREDITRHEGELIALLKNKTPLELAL